MIGQGCVVGAGEGILRCDPEVHKQPVARNVESKKRPLHISTTGSRAISNTPPARGKFESEFIQSRNMCGSHLLYRNRRNKVSAFF